MSVPAPFGLVPRWPLVPLKRVARLGTGHTPDRKRPELWENCTIPWITTGEVAQMRDDRIERIYETREAISELGVENSAAVVHPAGTVVLSRTASAGYSAIMGMDMATSQDFVTWTCGPQLRPEYLLWCLRAMRPHLLGQLAMGSTHKTIYMPDLEALRVPLPPVEAQVQILEHLRAELAELDAVDVQLQRIRSLLEERMFGLVSHLMTRVATREQPGLMPWLEPDGEFIPLRHLATIQSGMTVDGGRSHTGPMTTRPYLRVANVKSDHLDLDDVTTIEVPAAVAPRFELKVGDVLMTEGGDLDKLGRGTVWNGEISGCLHQNHVFAVRPLPGKLEPRFLALLTQTQHARCYFESTGSRSTNLASTSSSKIMSFPIPALTLERQREVVHLVESEVGQVREALAALQHQTTLLAERRQVLIAEAVTGKLDVSGVAA